MPIRLKPSSAYVVGSGTPAGVYVIVQRKSPDKVSSPADAAVQLRRTGPWLGSAASSAAVGACPMVTLPLVAPVDGGSTNTTGVALLKNDSAAFEVLCVNVAVPPFKSVVIEYL